MGGLVVFVEGAEELVGPCAATPERLPRAPRASSSSRLNRGSPRTVDARVLKGDPALGPLANSPRRVPWWPEVPFPRLPPGDMLQLATTNVVVTLWAMMMATPVLTGVSRDTWCGPHAAAEQHARARSGVAGSPGGAVTAQRHC